jgi:hypothetical protein
MIHSKLIPSLLLVGALALGFTSTPARAQVNLGSGIVINDIDLQGVAIDPLTGVLTATGGTVTGTIAGLPFTTEITDFAIDLLPDNPATPATECSVLHLALAPIDLDLLGLNVDTSAICLDITGIEGGGLLGDLLCGLAGGDGLSLLERLALLDDVLGGLGDLTGVLTKALNQGLSGPASHQEPADICDGDCEILDLAVGPVDLTLLGLHVHLDNCDDGPVQVCVSATAGGGLLGNLLCGLTDGGLLGGINLGLIEDLLGSILGVNGVADLNAPAKQVNQLVAEVGRMLADGQLTDNELSRLTSRVEKLVRKN